MEELIKIVGNPNKSCVIVEGEYLNHLPYIKGRIFALELEIKTQGKILCPEKQTEAYLLEVIGKNARFKLHAKRKSIQTAILDQYPYLSEEDRQTKQVIHATNLVSNANTELKKAKAALVEDLTVSF